MILIIKALSFETILCSEASLMELLPELISEKAYQTDIDWEKCEP
jgi:hypothetical protein